MRQMPLPGFSPAARRRLIFGPDETAGSASTLRSRRAAAERAFLDLETDGVIDLQRDHHDPASTGHGDSTWASRPPPTGSADASRTIGMPKTLIQPRFSLVRAPPLDPPSGSR